MKKIVSVILSLTFILSTAAYTVSAESSAVKVKISPFTNEIEHMSVYNGIVRYPLLFYKDITYLPLTGGVCERLGLATGFDPEKGLYITKAQLPYKFEDSEAFGESDGIGEYYGLHYEYEAQISEYPIYLNGIRINNHKEEYPFLNFRGITYMPLTYKFAVEELDLYLEWSNENQHIRLYKSENYFTEKMTDIYTYVEVGNITDSYISLMKTSHGYTEYPLSAGHYGNGQPLRYSYHWYDVYRFETESDRLSHLGTTFEFKNELYERRELSPRTPSGKITLTDGTLYYDGTALETYEKSETGVGAVGAYGYEFPLGDKTVIFAGVSFGSAPAPYTVRNEFLFLKTESGITKLENYDSLCNFSGLYPDGKGGAFICTYGYRPASSSRWSNPHSSVYYLSPDGILSDLTESYPDINSIRAIGYADGKLYVQAMYYGSQKSVYAWDNTFSTVNSGYYVIDSEKGNSITKLYPYVDGEAFVTESGGFYLCADYAKKPRIINLISGIITEVE